MSTQEQEFTGDVTPEQFAQLITGATDDEIGTTIRAVGTREVLDRIFTAMQERFSPEKARGVDATIQFVITDEGTEYPYAVKISDGTCTVDETKVDDAKSTITTDIVSFAKLVAGVAQGPQLFMSGSLKVGGDLMFSTRVMTFFDQPKA